MIFLPASEKDVHDSNLYFTFRKRAELLPPVWSPAAIGRRFRVGNGYSALSNGNGLITRWQARNRSIKFGSKAERAFQRDLAY